MIEFRKILVPIDFSVHSEKALDDAIGLARRQDAELHLLHCYPISPGAISPYGMVVPETFEHDVRVAALRRLAELSEKARGAGHRVQEHLSPRLPAEEIAAVAERIGADLIVMGTRGLTGVKHVLLGSVAERTIRVAGCPVLTVKRSGAP